MNLRTAPATILIGVVGTALIAVLGWLLLLGPLTAKVSETKDAVDAAVDRNQLMTGQVAGLEQQKERLPKIRTVADELAELFPATADQPGFFAAVNDAAREAGISPDNVTTLSPTAPSLVDASGEATSETTTETAPTAPTTPATGTSAEGTPSGVDLAQQTVSITVEGSYDEVQKLVANLEDMPRAFVIDSLSISSGESSEGGPSALTVSITGSTFVAPPVDYPHLEHDSSSSAG